MRILRDNAIAMVIDIQERLFPHIDRHDEIEKNCAILIEGLQQLGIPMIVTEQYPKGLGPTISPLKALLSETPPVEKMTFSCCGVTGVTDRLAHSGRRQVIVFGIEAHVCVLQTTLDLLDLGYQPVVIADCISSRKPDDKRTAVHRMRQSGAFVSSFESILFELCRTAGTEEFKAISRLVK